MNKKALFFRCTACHQLTKFDGTKEEQICLECGQAYYIDEFEISITFEKIFHEARHFNNECL